MLKFCYNSPHKMQQKIGHMHALGEQQIGHMHWGSGIIFATQRANHLSIKLMIFFFLNDLFRVVYTGCGYPIIRAGGSCKKCTTYYNTINTYLHYGY